jgi:hypothetical protein
VVGRLVKKLGQHNFPNARPCTNQKGVRECTPNKTSGDETVQGLSFNRLSLELHESIVYTAIKLREGRKIHPSPGECS